MIGRLMIRCVIRDRTLECLLLCHDVDQHRTGRNHVDRGILEHSQIVGRGVEEAAAVEHTKLLGKGSAVVEQVLRDVAADDLAGLPNLVERAEGDEPVTSAYVE